MTITKEQLAERRKSIGASDMGALFGVSPWSTAYDLWASKVYELADQGSEAAELGNDCEDMLLDWLGRQLGAPVTHRHAEPYGEGPSPLTAHLDGLVDVDGVTCVAEAKVTSRGWEWGAAGTDVVSYRVTLQVQTQMYLAECPRAYVVVMLSHQGRLERRWYVVERDDRIIAKIISIATAWWDTYVTKRTPPPEQPTLSVVQRIVREEQGEGEDPVPVAAHLLEARNVADLAYEEASKAKEQANANVLAALGDRRLGTTEAGHVITYKEQTRKEYTVKASTFSVLRVRQPAKEEAADE